MSRFEYVKYDENSCRDSENAKHLVERLEQTILAVTSPSREQAIALTKLEECFMWIGKGIRNEQVKREQRAHAVVNSYDEKDGAK